MYLKSFAIRGENEEPRLWKAWAVSRDKVFRASLHNLCSVRAYYSPDQALDARLFSRQEALLSELLPALAAGATAPPDIASQVWLLKLRSQAILQTTQRRLEVMQAGYQIDLGVRTAEVIDVPHASGALITSDDPVLLLGLDVRPDLQGFVLPISPRKLLMSVPTSEYALVGTQASVADVTLLNRLQCSQAWRYVIMRDRPDDAGIYQRAMTESPRPTRSGAINTREGRSVILNFRSINPLGPDGLPSFLRLKG